MGYLKLTYREQNPTLKVVKGLFFSIEKSCAEHYHYDIHGNVKSLLHDNPTLSTLHSSLNTQRYKRMDYTYDLISGNVKMVSYQNGQPDAWHHAYEYDADNRIKTVHTSTYPDASNPAFLPSSYTGSAFWDEDVVYHYYDHGPISRVELGENNVQGVDFAYTLGGWLVATNSNTLQVLRDMGLDGSQALLPNGSENSNKNFARDAFSFSLGYYNGDYTPIDGAATFLADKTGSDLLASTNNLYNGNISSMVTTITTPVTFVPEPTFEILAQSNAYTYDRLNRLRESKSFANLDFDNNVWMNSGNPYDGRYHNQFTYNANGGMLTAFMKNALGETIDNQTYHRATTTNGRYINNRTYAITDVATQTSGEDLLDQQAFDNTVLSNNNYDFTEIGERNKNLSEDIENITWTVYGKKAAVKRTATSGKNNVTFNYDPQNNRIAKHVYTSDDIWVNSEYYVHDAQGNLMATYRLEASSGSGLSYELTERHIYGSNSIGINTTPVEMIGVTPPTDTYTHIIGDKRFNGSNHLQNVLSVFTDKKLPLDIDNNGIIDGYLPQVISANDYAPFGSRLSERTFNKELYPNSFNGKRESAELDGEQDYGERDYNPKEREFDKDDPIGRSFPYYSPYQFAGNKPIVAIDFDGLEPVFVHGTWAGSNTWAKSFKEEMTKALGYDTGDAIEDVDWGGGNSVLARAKAANQIVARLTDVKKNPLANEKYAVLIGHSHGGNVNKLVKRKLLAMGWTVDMINIETPQRTDFKSPKGGININFYSEADLVQFLGSFPLIQGFPEFTLSTTGRKDPNATNFKLSSFSNALTYGKSWYEKPFIEFGHAIETNIPKWVNQTLGHSLHNDYQSQNTIVKTTQKIFKGRRKKAKSKSRARFE